MGKYEAVTTDRRLVILDAVNRAVRTWWQVVGAGILAAIGDLGLRLLIDGDVMSFDFWSTLLRGTITAVLAASFAYWARFRKPPKPAPETTTLPDNSTAVVTNKVDGRDSA
jgi:hypothetical protein